METVNLGPDTDLDKVRVVHPRGDVYVYTATRRTIAKFKRMKGQTRDKIAFLENNSQDFQCEKSCAPLNFDLPGCSIH